MVELLVVVVVVRMRGELTTDRRVVLLPRGHFTSTWIFHLHVDLLSPSHFAT